MTSVSQDTMFLYLFNTNIFIYFYLLEIDLLIKEKEQASNQSKG